MDSLRRPLGGLVLLALSACGGGGDGGTGPAPSVTVAVTASASSVDAGGTATVTATVANGRTGGVTWTSSGGSLVPSGASATWTAPLTAGSYTVTATSTDDATKSASTTLTVAPIGVTMATPTATVASGATRAFSASVTGAVNAALTWSASAGTLSSTTGATVSWTAPVGGGTATITAASAADPTRSATATVTVTPVVVALTPRTSTVGAAGAAALTAAVTGGVDSSVTWQATGGIVQGTGRAITWQAPVAAGSYVVRATSTLDPTKRDSAVMTVTPVVVTLAPSTSAPFRGQPVTVVATVTGAAAGRDSVTWSGTCGAGVEGVTTFALTAPTQAGPCTVTATSRLDGARFASATLTVRNDWLITSADDANDGACTYAHCSLREAITAANATPALDTLRLDLPVPAAAVGATVRAAARGAAAMAASAPQRAPQRAALTGAITLTSALPLITTPMVILGPGAGQLTVDAAATTGAQRRVLEVAGTMAVVVRGLTLRGGVGAEGAGMLIRGGASVEASDLVVRNNTSLTLGGGGIGVRGTSTLDLRNSTITENRAETPTIVGAAGVGGIENSVIVLRDVTVSNNTATVGGAGGAGVEGATLRLFNVTVSGNTSALGGGGIAAWTRSTLEIVGGTVRNNVSALAGGGILIGSTNHQAGTRTVASVRGVLVEANEAQTQGGGIQVTRNAELVLDSVRVIGNALRSTTATLGGGVVLGGTVSGLISRLLVSGNSTLPGASSVNDGGGGMAYMGFEAPSSLTIQRSTLVGNTTNGYGAGILVYANGGQARLENVTVSGNTGGIGGGVVSRQQLTVVNSTIVGNRGTAAGSGLLAVEASVLTVRNTMLADNRTLTNVVANCATMNTAQIVSAGNNLSSDACAAFTQPSDKVSVDPGLQATLGNNGGVTPTHALLAGSPAINAGEASACPAVDQRGAARVGVCDIGAFEFGGVVPASRILAGWQAVAQPLLRRPAVMLPAAGDHSALVRVPPAAGGGRR